MSRTEPPSAHLARAMVHHKVKILCTMGPAVASTERIVALVKAGATAFRLNMSHGDHATHAGMISMIRKAEEKLDVHLPIIVDLQGPKIRVADFTHVDAIPLVAGTDIRIVDAGVAKSVTFKPTETVIPVTYPSIARDVKKGHLLLFDDGLIKVQVRETDGTSVRAIVVHGGLLKPRKGLNLPDTQVSQPSMTAKDRADAKFAVQNGADYIALSFVRKAADVEALRRQIVKCGGSQWVIAKVEKPEALQNIEAIIDASDAIMVARGDLGVEIPAASVPIVQKRIIHLCNAKAKPVITATQMLESMIHNARPTRAEASDVANAVLDGTDVVMLSAETSVGAYPTEAVHTMRTICEQAEEVLLNDGRLNEHYEPPKGGHRSNTESIAVAVAQIAEEKRLSAIISLSYSGETTRLISNQRPRAPIVSVTTDLGVARRIGLLWGVTGMLIETLHSTDETIDHIKTTMLREKLFPAGATVVFTIGRPLVGRARTNMLSIESLEK